MLERFVPNEAVERLSQVELGDLRARGIKAILLDLDGAEKAELLRPQFFFVRFFFLFRFCRSYNFRLLC